MNYLEERLVPPKNLKFLKFYYNHEKEEIFNNSIVFPFYNRGYGSYYGFQSRRLNNKIFHIELQDPNYPKLYNIFNVDLTKEVYIFEGFFDSLSIDNSVSMNGSDVPTKYLKMIKKPIFVFDNDDTGFKKILKYARIGYSCFIYPENFGHKDFNEYKIHNPSVDTSRIIRDNIYSSEYAIMKAQERQLR
jgi:DNA primase